LPDLIALLLRVGWIAFVFAVLLLVVCGITVNNGNRMAPSFHDRDVVIYYRLARDIEAGEVVVYQAENGRLLVGRVIAAAGDAVDIDEKGVRINGYYQAELYARGDTVLFEGGTALPVTLGTGEYFILCDDRSQSSDSRTFGPVPESRIKGRVMLMIRQRDF
jgi:signal peptidase I